MPNDATNATANNVADPRLIMGSPLSGIKSIVTEALEYDGRRFRPGVAVAANRELTWHTTLGGQFIMVVALPGIWNMATRPHQSVPGGDSAVSHFEGVESLQSAASMASMSMSEL